MFRGNVCYGEKQRRVLGTGALRACARLRRVARESLMEKAMLGSA